MPNPWTGEVTVVIDGESHVCKLTLGALAELEEAIDAGSLMDLIRRFETGEFSGRDVMAVLIAGLRGGGWSVTAADLVASDIQDGPIGAAKVAGLLLTRAFTPPA